MSEETQGSSLRHLFRQHLDGALTAAEFADLEQRLANDPAARVEYVRFTDLEACLHEEMTHRAEPTTIVRPQLRSWTWLIGTIIATAACVLLFVNLFPRPVAVVEQPQPLPAESVAPAYYLPAPLQGLPDVAVVTAIEGITQPELREQLQVGTRLKSGIVKLTEGELQLDFLGGVRVLLSAPVELHMVSNSAASLVNGAVGVRVSHAQKSFVLNAPDVAVVDLSTEFAVRVDADRHTQVHVYAGEVEISLLGDDGNTLISQRLSEHGTVDVDPQARLFTALDTPTSALPRVREADRNDLDVTAEYVQQVERSQPYLYWRFESMEDGVIRDSSGNGFDAQVVGNPEDAKTIRIVDGVLEFGSCPGPRSVVTTKPVPNFNSGDSSIELWVMPSELSPAVVLGVLLPGDGPVPMHLNLIELAHNTALVHQPGVIRFLHRQPPRQLGGYNLFSQDICIPGLWTHVVATKTLDELKLYVNGQLLRTASGPGTGARDDLDYNIMLGQLSPGSKARQFNGWIDEVAVYRRVLPAAEVSQHYWSIVGPKPVTAAKSLDRTPHALVRNSLTAQR